MNKTPKEILRSIVTASFGLIVFAFGGYLTIQANTGTRPWDVFAIGLSKRFNVLYGTASITVALTVLVIDILLKEKIGIGMLLDTFIVGKTIDVLNYFNVVPARQSTVGGVICLILGITVSSFAYYLCQRDLDRPAARRTGRTRNDPLCAAGRSFHAGGVQRAAF